MLAMGSIMSFQKNNNPNNCLTSFPNSFSYGRVGVQVEKGQLPSVTKITQHIRVVQIHTQFIETCPCQAYRAKSASRQRVRVLCCVFHIESWKFQMPFGIPTIKSYTHERFHQKNCSCLISCLHAQQMMVLKSIKVYLIISQAKKKEFMYIY